MLKYDRAMGYATRLSQPETRDIIQVAMYDFPMPNLEHRKEEDQWKWIMHMQMHLCV